MSTKKKSRVSKNEDPESESLEKIMRSNGEYLVWTPAQGMPNRAVGRTFRTHRKDLVARLYLTGQYTLQDISEYVKEHYGVSIHPTVFSRDLKELRERWQANALKSTNEHITGEIGKLDNLEQMLAKAYAAGELDSKDYATESVRIAKRRASLLGFDKAQKVEIHDKRVSDLSDEELEKIVKPHLKKGEQ